MKYYELNEKKQHGSLGFPIEYYHVNKDYYQYVMPLHWHKEFEIIRIISGKFTIYINNEKTELMSGDIGFIGCGQLHRGDPENCLYECIVFDPALLLRGSSDPVTRQIAPVISGKLDVINFPDSDKNLKICIDRLFYEMSAENKHYELSVMASLFEIFGILYRNNMLYPSKYSSGKAHHISMMIDLIDWMEHNFHEKITLKMLADRTDLSEKHICRLFKDYTSRTPIEYVNELRVDYAYNLIAIKGYSITSAAYESGFNDLAYFSRVFKKHKGIPPSKVGDQINKF